MEFQKTALQKKLTVEAVVTVHYFEYTPDFSFPGEVHDFWEFVYVDKGEVTVTQGARDVHLTRGEIAFHAPMEFHALRAAGSTAPSACSRTTPAMSGEGPTITPVRPWTAS